MKNDDNVATKREKKKGKREKIELLTSFYQKDTDQQGGGEKCGCEPQWASLRSHLKIPANQGEEEKGKKSHATLQSNLIEKGQSESIST